MVSSSFLPHLLPPPQLGDCSRAWREGRRGGRELLLSVPGSCPEKDFLCSGSCPGSSCLSPHCLFPPPPCRGCSGGCPAPPSIPRMRLGAPQLLVSVGEVGNGTLTMPSRDTLSLSLAAWSFHPRGMRPIPEYFLWKSAYTPAPPLVTRHLTCCVFKWVPQCLSHRAQHTTRACREAHLSPCAEMGSQEGGVPGGQSPWAIGRCLLGRGPSHGSIWAWWRRA